MPITITTPVNGGTIGPGLLVNASSDFDFGANPGFEWWWAIVTEGGVALRQRWQFSGHSPFAQNFLTGVRQSGIDQDTSIALPKDGDPVQLVVEITNGGIVAQEARQQTVWSTTQGLGVQQYLNTQQPAASFTAQDRANLQTVVDNSTVDLTDRTIPPDLSAVPVGRLSPMRPLIWSERVGPFTLTGRDVLDLPSHNIRGVWLGLRWFYSATPPGWGMRPGAIDEFDNRPAQIVPICQLENGEEIGRPILDTNTSGGFVDIEDLWFSGRVAYDVAPGFTVSLFMYRFIGSG